jgi:hypothetical protein
LHARTLGTAHSGTIPDSVTSALDGVHSCAECRGTRCCGRGRDGAGADGLCHSECGTGQ